MGNTFEKFASIACTFAVEVLAIPRNKSVSRAVSPGFCTRLVGSWWGGQIVPGTESRRNLCQEVIQDIQISLKIEFCFLIVKPSASFASIKKIKSFFQRNIQCLGNFHDDTSDALPPNYVADFSVLLFTHSSITSKNFRYLSRISWFKMQIWWLGWCSDKRPNADA